MEVNSQNVGTNLSLQPTIQRNNNVLLKIDFLSSFHAGNVVNPAVLAMNHTANSTKTFEKSGQIPLIDKQSIKTTAYLAPGEGILLGGLSTYKEHCNNSGTPLLARLFFANSTISLLVASGSLS